MEAPRMALAPVLLIDDGMSASVAANSSQETYFHVQRYGTLDQERNRRWFTLEEAFYLVSIDRVEIQNMTRHEAWTLFSRSDEMYGMRYVAYAHYRDNGWIVQSGHLYGVTFTLYRMSPDVVHSEYMVYLHQTNSSWHVMQMLTRLAEDVKKTVLLVQVISSDHESDQMIDVCGTYFSLKEVRMRHWPALFTDGTKSYDMKDSTAIPKRI
ncbi:hypothetical protein LEN26_014405 [Aphanomyces euteiches]|nr:hypothetical protein LEN26_014405 [Aphanomyces euteiches]KAH9125330.1 hypothetical protein AeMF1_004034 [Aphanomyces euteiches]KAH9189488.1 hypothetical protein AeNC1_008534 [Aphanomyces euteiches]